MATSSPSTSDTILEMGNSPSINDEKKLTDEEKGKSEDKVEKVDEEVDEADREVVEKPSEDLNSGSEKEDEKKLPSPSKKSNEKQPTVSFKNVAGPSKGSLEEVDSKRSTKRPVGSGAEKSTNKNLEKRQLKRRSSRISTPAVSRSSRNVNEQEDSGTPRSSYKRNTKKRMVALFLESDFPRRK